MASDNSVADWWHLGPDERARVNDALNGGHAVDDPQLRPIVAAMASGNLRESGWRVLRRPFNLIVAALACAVLAISGYWWLLCGLAMASATGLWIVERRARRLRPQWLRALAANR